MDIPLLIVTLALMAALVLLALFLIVAWSIRAGDRLKDPFSAPCSEVEHTARSVLMFARRKDRPEDTTPAPDRERR
ncbi:hypothetical protein [Nonomuraea sp. B19D2]|uniref:hypothetical protein n=1 Tax=Nonomuraea sp. B19D2 TaxID=3159561 RepID=UPI0032DAFB10